MALGEVLTFGNLCVSLLNFATCRIFSNNNKRQKGRRTHTWRNLLAKHLGRSTPLSTNDCRWLGGGLKASERETENQLNCRCGLNMKANMAQTTLAQVNKNIVKPKTLLFLAFLHTRLNAQFMRCNL